MQESNMDLRFCKNNSMRINRNHDTTKSLNQIAEKKILPLAEIRPMLKKTSNQNVGGFRYEAEKAGFLNIEMDTDNESVSSDSSSNASPGEKQFEIWLR